VNPKLLWVIDQLHKQGLSGRPLQAKLAPLFKEAREDEPTRQAVVRHYSAHCAAGRAEKERKQEEALAKAGDDYESDYIELRGLYADFRKIFTQVKHEFADREENDEKTSAYSLVMLLKLASELRNMLKTLADMRNSEKLFSVVLVRHTEQFVAFLSEPLGYTLRDIRDRLARGEDPTVVAERVDKLLGGELFPLFENAAKQAIERSRNQYKLN
jgi:predicted outer membrane protein